MIRECKERKKQNKTKQDDSEVSGLGEQWSLWAKWIVMNFVGLCTIEEKL